MNVAGLLADLAAMGRDPDSGGYRRLAFTGEDAALGEWFSARCTDLGLEVTIDRCGNQWAWWGDPDAALAQGERAIVTGSHLDSVPDGGAYDGPLGVATALAAVDRLRRSGFEPSRPISVVRFLDEEGGRFSIACSGSRLLTGAMPPATVLAQRDAEGLTFAEAARSSGLRPENFGRDDETLNRIGAFVEVHVEQGRALATAELNSALGVATAIRPHGRWRLDRRGRADHAGTTLLEDRIDPMLDLARFVLAVRAEAQACGALATVGKVVVRPNAVNAVPAHVSAWMDARGEDAQRVESLVSRLGDEGFDLTEESFTPRTAFDPVLIDALARAASQACTGEAVPRLATGAGHDAGILANAGIRTAMLFVRNPTGISHSPVEFAEADDCERGVDALTLALRDLAGPRGK